MSPTREQQRGASVATMTNISAAAARPAEVDRDDFKATPKEAILRSMPMPRTEDEGRGAI